MNIVDKSKVKDIIINLYVNRNCDDQTARSKILDWKRAHLEYQAKSKGPISFSDWLISIIDKHKDS